MRVESSIRRAANIGCFLLLTLDSTIPSSKTKIFQLNVCEFTITSLGAASHFSNSSRQITSDTIFQSSILSKLRICTAVVGNCRSPASSIAPNGAVTKLAIFHP